MSKKVMEIPEGWKLLGEIANVLPSVLMVSCAQNVARAQELLMEMAEALALICENHHLKYEDADSVLDAGVAVLEKFKEWK